MTPPQHHIYFATFDLTTTKRDEVVKLLQAWTEAAARMAEGETAQPMESGLKLAVPRPPAELNKDPNKDDEGYGSPDPSTTPADTGETMGMSPSRLTLTFGFGAGLFIKDGKDRYGLASRRPQALVDLPKFVGDQMVEGHTAGDLAIQACAEDPQVAFHAVRQLARIAEGVAQLRWVQIGYRPATGERHLLGFSNGKGNPSVDDPQAMADSVWVGDEGPNWMRGGSYVVVRRIRFALEHWDHMPQAYQEKAVGESKHPGMPVDKTSAPPADLVEDENAQTHLRIVTPGAKSILRRSYSYNDGVNFTTERWPPWRQGLEYDAGMFFCLLSARSANRVHHDVRQDGKIRRDVEPVLDPRRRRAVRLSARPEKRGNMSDNASSNPNRCKYGRTDRMLSFQTMNITSQHWLQDDVSAPDGEALQGRFINARPMSCRFLMVFLPLRPCGRTNRIRRMRLSRFWPRPDVRRGLAHTLGARRCLPWHPRIRHTGIRPRWTISTPHRAGRPGCRQFVVRLGCRLLSAGRYSARRSRT